MTGGNQDNDGRLQRDNEWDLLGPVRHSLITEGRDLSFEHILTPYMTAFVRRLRPDYLLDAGCGTGNLTAALAVLSGAVVGVDASRISIELARRDSCRSNVEYFCDSIESYAKTTAARFNCCAANMLLMDTGDAIDVVEAIRSLLLPDGHLCLTIPHPCFWSTMRGSNTTSATYMEVGSYLEEFGTTLVPKTGIYRTHWHRPISWYVKMLTKAGYNIKSIDELAPPSQLANVYGDMGHLPRILGIECNTTG